MSHRWFNKLTSVRGFTMIELLVVIAIIGVLAVAVLSAINPIEQINKGRDTRSRSDSAELLGSLERYYATQEAYPWNVTASAVGQITAFTTIVSVSPLAAYNSTGAWNFLASLVESNEVKPQFGDRMFLEYGTGQAGSEKMIVLKELSTLSEQVRVCFLPTSRQFKLEAAKRCCPSVTAGGICASAGSLAGQQPETINTYRVCAVGSQTGLATWTQDRNLICLP